MEGRASESVYKSNFNERLVEESRILIPAEEYRLAKEW